MKTVFPKYRQSEEYANAPASDPGVILSDADLSGSAAISFEQFEKETKSVEAEVGFSFTPEMRYKFLKSIGPMKSVAGTFIEENQEAILDRARKEAE